jgi:hypothetical protein
MQTWKFTKTCQNVNENSIDILFKHLRHILNVPCLDCPGVLSEAAGKTSTCEGCPNQKICASGAAKEVDPGAYLAK